MLRKLKDETQNEGINVNKIRKTRSDDLLMSLNRNTKTQEITEKIKEKFKNNKVQNMSIRNQVLHIRNIDGIATEEER